MAGGQVVEWGHYTASIHCRTYCPGPDSHRTTHLVLLQSSVNTVMYTQAQYVKKEEAHTVVLHFRITSVWSAKIPSENLQYQAETTCLRINMSE